jgi:hypothetical protein
MLTLVASLVLTGATIRRIAAPSDPGRAELVLAVTSWIEEHVPQGETVGFGGSLANNVAVELIRRNPAAQVREQQGIVFSARSPFAVRVPGTSSVHDWIALFDAPRNPRTFYGYSLTSFERQLRSSSVNTLVLMGTEDDPGIVIAKQLFTPDHGVQVLASWDLPVHDPAVAGLVLGVQPDRLRFGSDVLMTEDALRRLVVQLQDAGVAGREAAAEVLDRVVVVDPGPQSISLEATLRRLAAGG